MTLYVELLGLFIEQQNGSVIQIKVVTHGIQNAFQHLIQIEGGEDDLTGII